MALATGLRPAAARDASAASDTASGAVSLPLLYGPPLYPCPLVMVRINGSEPLAFLVDTGTADPVLLTRWAADKLQIEKLADAGSQTVARDDQPYKYLTFSKPERFDLVTADGSPSLHIDGAPILCPAGRSGPQVPQADSGPSLDDQFASLSQSPKVAGILGIGFWEGSALQFDFGLRTLTVYIRQAPKAASGDAVVTLQPAGDDDPRPMTSATLSGTAAGKPAPAVHLLVDTGCIRTSLPESLRAGAASRSGGAAHVLQHRGVVQGQTGLLATLKLNGAAPEPDIEVNWLGGGASADALLGMNFLSRFRVTLDMAHSRLLLGRSGGYLPDIDRQVSGALGIGVRRDPAGRYVVSDVPEGTALLGGTVEPGDELLEVDGYDLSAAAPVQADQILAGRAGTVACLVVRHARSAGATVDTVWTARSDPYAAEPGPAPTAIRLLSMNTAEVTYDGAPPQKVIGVPYTGNPDALPPGSVIGGDYGWERVAFVEGADREWAMVEGGAPVAGSAGAALRPMYLAVPAPPSAPAEASAASAAPPAGLYGVTVPFRPADVSGSPAVAVRIGEAEEPEYFLIDTGAGRSSVTPDAAQRLGLPPADDGRSVRVDRLQIGDVAFRGDLQIAPSDAAVAGRSVAGVLGGDLLASFACLLDFTQDQCTFLDRGALSDVSLRWLGFPGGVESGTTLEPVTGGDGVSLLAFRAPLRVGGKQPRTVPLLLATGSERTTLPKSAGDAAKGMRRVGDGTARFPDASYSYKTYRMDSAAVGSAAPLSAFPVAVADKPAAGRDALLAVDFLSHFRVLIDYPARRLYLGTAGSQPYPTKTARANATVTFDGMVLAPDAAGVWGVREVGAAGRFGAAGVRSGDILVELNGRRTDGMTPGELTAAWDRDRGRTRLTVAQDGRQRRIEAQNRILSR